MKTTGLFLPLAASILVMIGLSFTATATPITFDFTGGGPNGTVLNFTAGSLVLEVSARPTISGNTARVTHGNGGLGVRSSGDTTGLLDSLTNNEQLVFTLINPTAAGVTGLILEEIAFTRFNIGGQQEDISLRINGNNPLGNSFTPSTNPWDISNDLSVADRTYNPFDPNNTSFRIRVFNQGGTEDLRVASITATVIPEPSTIALLGLGLGFLGYRRRKKA